MKFFITYTHKSWYKPHSNTYLRIYIHVYIKLCCLLKWDILATGISNERQPSRHASSSALHTQLTGLSPILFIQFLILVACALFLSFFLKFMTAIFFFVWYFTAFRHKKRLKCSLTNRDRAKSSLDLDKYKSKICVQLLLLYTLAAV